MESSYQWVLDHLALLESSNKQERQQAEQTLANLPDQNALCNALIGIVGSGGEDAGVVAC
jgi:hypothetical protein